MFNSPDICLLWRSDRKANVCAAVILIGLLPENVAAYDSAAAEFLMQTADRVDKTVLLLIVFFTLSVTGLLAFLWQRRFKKSLYEWEAAYFSIEQHLEERTQKLRGINNMLYAEIAQHEMTEEKLRKAQEYLNSIINSMPSVLISVTVDGRITHWNTSTERATERSADEVAGKLLWQVYPSLPITLEMIQQAINDGIPKVIESSKLENDGKTIFNDIIIYPLAARDTQEAVIRIDDVTLRIMMENMMVQNEKMLSLGELAAGMAHEINNPLSAILQSVQNIERRLSADLDKNNEVADRLHLDIVQVNSYLKERHIFEFLATIRDAGERSAGIVANMLSFSRAGRQHAPVDFNALINDCLKFADNNLAANTSDGTARVEIKYEFGNNIPPVSCSASEMQQVLLNLLRNAAQALRSSRQEKPLITVSSGHDGVYAWVKVADNGDGIPHEIRSHIFEPFFTTKEVGQGTGLGLSISYFIVTEHHGGSIEVESKPGAGSSFTIRLPL